MYATLGGALLVLIVLFAASAILPSCGLRIPGPWSLEFCPGPARSAPALEVAQARRAALEDRVRGLERRLAGLPACRSAEAGRGLDRERWEEQDVGLLEGCWSLASDYSIRNVDTGEISEVEAWEMCFDASGEGSQTLRMTDGSTCTGEVAAGFEPDGRLRINDIGNPDCGDTYIYERRILCELAPGGAADCISRQPETDSRSRVRIAR